MIIPKKLNFIHAPTPIHYLSRLSKEIGKNIYIWRDDLTGCVESGNKIRKLEFIFFDALNKNASTIITCGGPQSNHTRATTYLAKRLGLDIHIIVRKPPKVFLQDAPHSGNFLLNKLCGATLNFIEFEDYVYHNKKYDYFLEKKQKDLLSQKKLPYIIPEGASCPLGLWGYINAVKEFISTWINTYPHLPYPDSIICALGSGGTFAGLHIGVQIYKIPTKIYAFNVCDNKEYFTKKVNELINKTCEEFAIPNINCELNIIDGYVGQGYALATNEELKFYIDIASKEGILLDPCYTGKAFKGMLSQIQKNPNSFGDNILFLHSGGIFGNFAYLDQYYQIL